MEKKRTLIEKYNIPLNHLDFKYIEECQNAREMEKIVHVLRSQEEGYYPDLTKCAEDKLRLLKPNSRHFRIEEPIRNWNSLSTNEKSPFEAWTNDIKTKEQKLEEAGQVSNSENELFPPIRKSGVINHTGENLENTDEITKPSENQTKVERIKSTDYSKWDKFDADEELLKMELAEERGLEEIERKNRLNLTKSVPTPKIEEILEQSTTIENRWSQLSEVEREKLVEEYFYSNERKSKGLTCIYCKFQSTFTR